MFLPRLLLVQFQSGRAPCFEQRHFDVLLHFQLVGFPHILRSILLTQQNHQSHDHQNFIEIELTFPHEPFVQTLS